MLPEPIDRIRMSDGVPGRFYGRDKSAHVDAHGCMLIEHPASLRYIRHVIHFIRQIIVLADHGYPPIDRDEVYKEIFEQAENFKKHQVQSNG